MRRVFLAAVLLAMGCDNGPAGQPAPVQKITVDPTAAARFKMRLGPNPGLVIGAPEAVQQTARPTVQTLRPPVLNRGGAQ